MHNFIPKCEVANEQVLSFRRIIEAAPTKGMDR
jgi:hypothetical protein